KAYIDGKFIATRWGKVHYSKTGTHIVPRLKEDKQ
ncbi:polymorphic toxin type 50 domain-containing protein, partial [Staphylococcus pseudintermedius]